MGDIEDNLRELFEIFNYPRVKKFQITRAANQIKSILLENGYYVDISQGFYANIETQCDYPKFIISAHYDSPFFFIKNEYVEGERQLNHVVSKDHIAMLVLVAGIIMINFFGKKLELSVSKIVLLYLLLLTIGPYILTTEFSSADDNTSGVVAALYLAHELRNYKNYVKFIFFDKEEWGLLGSKHYINNNAHKLTEHTSVINLDCVGRGEFIVLSSHENKHSENKFRNSFSQYLKRKNISFMTANTSMCDCKSFRKKGYEAFTVQRKDNVRGRPRLNWIHTLEDIPEHIDFKKMEELTRVIGNYIKDFIKREK